MIADRLAQAYPETNKGWGVLVEPLRTGVMSSPLQNTSLLLLGVVGFVLLLCCANVANLMLARGNVRAREMAVRSALGAGRSRIVAQLLTESLVLATLGGVLGAAIGAVILKVAPTLVPVGVLPAAATIAFDGRVAIFCAAAALIVGVLFGLVPAWQATRTSLLQAISSESRSSTRRGGRFRNVLVAAEVAAAVVLLCGAGLLLRTMLALGNFDPGYRADGDSVLTLDFSLPAPRPGTRYPDIQALTQFYDQATRDVSAIPGVRRDRMVHGSAVRHHQRDRTLRARDRRRSTFGSGRSSVGRLPGREPRLFRHARSADHHRPRVHRSRHVHHAEGLHRQRGIRPAIPRWKGPDRHATRDGGCTRTLSRHRSRDRRRRATAEGPPRRP